MGEERPETSVIDDLVIPEGVGPHTGIELELMLAGIKPAAMFYDSLPISDYPIPEDEFDPYVKSGLFVKKEAIYPMRVKTRIEGITHIRYVFYALAHEAWRVDELERIKRGFDNGKIQRCNYEDMDTAIGRLLGYSEEQIQAFLEHQKRFDK